MGTYNSLFKALATWEPGDVALAYAAVIFLAFTAVPLLAIWLKEKVQRHNRSVGIMKPAKAATTAMAILFFLLPALAGAAVREDIPRISPFSLSPEVAMALILAVFVISLAVTIYYCCRDETHFFADASFLIFGSVSLFVLAVWDSVLSLFRKKEIL